MPIINIFVIYAERILFTFQEAIQREASLESRLRNLRECVERTRAEAQASWELFVGEQRLLMRVHTLETMLSMGKVPDAHNISQLLNDKRNYQVKSILFSIVNS